jgi:hypothetical protein
MLFPRELQPSLSTIANPSHNLKAIQLLRLDDPTGVIGADEAVQAHES